MKRNWIKALAFFLLLGMLSSYFGKVAATAGTDSAGNYSAGITLAGLYAEPDDSIDVLIFGSSTSRAAFLPKILWDDQGITSYNLSTPSQSASIAYYLLQDALDKQSPSVVIINASQFFKDFDTESLLLDISSLSAVMKPSVNKLSFLNELSKQLSWQSIIELYLPILALHANMAYVEPGDFLLKNYRNPNNLKGAMPYLTCSVNIPDQPFLPNSDEIVSFDQTELQYMKKIQGLCEEHGIELLIAIPPKTKTWTKQNNALVESYCSEYGIEFLDMNESDILSETGFDQRQDFYDDGLHVNINGAIKLSHYLSDYLSKSFELADHTDDPAYSYWNNCVLPKMTISAE